MFLIPVAGVEPALQRNTILSRARLPIPPHRQDIYESLRFRTNGAEDRNRTGTVVTYRRILSPVRLPVPPPRHVYGGLFWRRQPDSNRW